jgi:hypothetical protein
LLLIIIMSNVRPTCVDMYKMMGLKGMKRNKYGMAEQWRICIVANSGGKKTQLAFNLVDELPEVEHLSVVAKNLQAPILEWAREKLDPDFIDISDVTLSPTEYEPGTCIILDDQVNEKPSTKKKPSNYQANQDIFIFGRQTPVYPIYTTQFWTKVNDKIQRLCTTIIANRIDAKDKKALKELAGLADDEMWDYYVKESRKDNVWMMINLDRDFEDPERVILLT